jgi:hypothetical protein
MKQTILNLKDTVIVCSECLTAACWHGEYMCDDAKNAGTIELPREELEKLALEHPRYWDTCPESGVSRASTQGADCTECGEKCQYAREEK